MALMEACETGRSFFFSAIQFIMQVSLSFCDGFVHKRVSGSVEELIFFMSINACVFKQSSFYFADEI